MLAQDGLHYSNEANISRFIFYKDLNDINLFVEDEDKEYEYETIFKRMFDNKYCIKAIFGVGGKPNLNKAFEFYGCRNHEKINIYIADGDFDRINQEKMFACNHYVYLEKYNIENYIIDENATHNFLKGKLHKKDDDVKKLIDFDNWEKTIISQAYKLFILYCTIKKHKPEIPNVGRNPYYFLNEKDGFEKPDAYNIYYKEVAGQIDELDSKIAESEKCCSDYCCGDYSKIICGKFLLTSLYVYTISMSKKKYTRDDFRWHLLSHFDISKLDYIKTKIERIIDRKLECLSYDVS
jgi:hypothetical protein